MMKRLLSLILIQSFLLTTLGAEWVWAKPVPAMWLRARSVANDGATRRHLLDSLQTLPPTAQDGQRTTLPQSEADLRRQIQQQVFHSIPGGFQIKEVYLSPDFAVYVLRERELVDLNPTVRQWIGWISPLEKLYQRLRRTRSSRLILAKQRAKVLIELLRGNFSTLRHEGFAQTVDSYALGKALGDLADPFQSLEDVTLRIGENGEKTRTFPYVMIRERNDNFLEDVLPALVREGRLEEAKARIEEMLHLEERIWEKKRFNADIHLLWNTVIRQDRVVLRDLGRLTQKREEAIRVLGDLHAGTLDELAHPIEKTASVLFEASPELGVFYRRKAYDVYTVENFLKHWPEDQEEVRSVARDGGDRESTLGETDPEEENRKLLRWILPRVGIFGGILGIALGYSLAPEAVDLFTYLRTHYTWQTDLGTGAFFTGGSDLIGQWFAHRADSRNSILKRQIVYATLIGAAFGPLYGKIYEWIEVLPFFGRVMIASFMGSVRGFSYTSLISVTKGRHPHLPDEVRQNYRFRRQIQKFFDAGVSTILVRFLRHMLIQGPVSGFYRPLVSFATGGILSPWEGWVLNRLKDLGLVRFIGRQLSHVLRIPRRTKETVTPVSTEVTDTPMAAERTSSRDEISKDGGTKQAAGAKGNALQKLLEVSPAEKRRLRKWWGNARGRLLEVGSDYASGNGDRTIARLRLQRILEEGLHSADEVLFALSLLGETDALLRPYFHWRLAELTNALNERQTLQRLKAHDLEEGARSILVDRFMKFHHRLVQGRIHRVLRRFEKSTPHLFRESFRGIHEKRLYAVAQRVFSENIAPQRSTRALSSMRDFATPLLDHALLVEVATIGEEGLEQNPPPSTELKTLRPSEREERARFLMQTVDANRRAFSKLIHLPKPVMQFRRDVLNETGVDMTTYWLLLGRPSHQVISEMERRRQAPGGLRPYLADVKRTQTALRADVRNLFDIDHATRWVLRDLRDHAPDVFENLRKTLFPQLTPRERELFTLVTDPRDYGSVDLTEKFLGYRNAAALIPHTEALFVKVRHVEDVQSELVQVLENVVLMMRRFPFKMNDAKYYAASWVVYQAGKKDPEGLERLARLYPAVFGSWKAVQEGAKLARSGRVIRGIVAGRGLQDIEREMAMEAGHTPQGPYGRLDVRDERDVAQRTLKDLMLLQPFFTEFLKITSLKLPWDKEWTMRIRQAVRQQVLLSLTHEEFDEMLGDYGMIPTVQARYHKRGPGITEREIAALHYVRASDSDTLEAPNPADVQHAFQHLESHPLFYKKFVEAGNQFKRRQESKLTVYEQDRALVKRLLQDLARDGEAMHITTLQEDYPGLHERIYSLFGTLPWKAVHSKERDVPLIALFAEGNTGPQIQQSRNAQRDGIATKEIMQDHGRIMSVLWFHPAIADRYVALMETKLRTGKWTLEDLYQFHRFKKAYARIHPLTKSTERNGTSASVVGQRIATFDTRLKTFGVWQLYTHVLKTHGLDGRDPGEELIGSLILQMPSGKRTQLFRKANLTKAQRIALNAFYPVDGNQKRSLEEAQAAVSSGRKHVYTQITHYARRKLEAYLVHEAMETVRLNGDIASPVRRAKGGSILFTQDGGRKRYQTPVFEEFAFPRLSPFPSFEKPVAVERSL